EILAKLDALTAGYDWRADYADRRSRGDRQAGRHVVVRMVDRLRAPATAPRDGEPGIGEQYRRLASQLARAWALCSTADELEAVRGDVRFYEEVRVWMAKLDADARQSRGEPVPEEIGRL